MTNFHLVDDVTCDDKYAHKNGIPKVAVIDFDTETCERIAAAKATLWSPGFRAIEIEPVGAVRFFALNLDEIGLKAGKITKAQVREIEEEHGTEPVNNLRIRIDAGGEISLLGWYDEYACELDVTLQKPADTSPLIDF